MPGMRRREFVSAARRRGGGVAARGARAAGGQDRARWIPKADGRQRPLGIAALEDKIVQAAVVAILTPIYEAEFLGFSYGFRPERRQHQALDALAFGSGRRRINWVLMPPTYVKAYLKRGKNDAADAAAICEAVTTAASIPASWDTMRAVTPPGAIPAKSLSMRSATRVGFSHGSKHSDHRIASEFAAMSARIAHKRLNELQRRRLLRRASTHNPMPILIGEN